MTYYILAAQTIHFELFIIEQNKFLPINRDQWSLTPRQSIKVLASLICPQQNNQCKTQWELQAMLTLRVRLAWQQSQVNIDCSFDTLH